MHQVSKRQEIREGLQVPVEELDKRQLSLLKWEEPGFDLRVHIKDPMTGTLLKFQPYRRLVDVNGVTFFRKDEKGIERRYSEQGLPLDKAPAPESAGPKGANEHKILPK